jgi:alkylation response protein AidB-like acyl-CoA dehydrogenase
MNFQINKDQEQIRNKVREFAEKKIAPIAAELDAGNKFPEDIVKEMGRLAIMGLPFPPSCGGAGADIISYAMAVEELSRVDGGVGTILSAHISLGSWPIYAYGSEAQKEKYLKPLASGQKLGAFGLTEVNAGSDAGGTETTALLQGSHYLLNGGKIFITNADYAHTNVIFASTAPGQGIKGISAFIVEKGWEGFTYGMHYNKMGIRSSATAELIFKNVKIPRENLLGQEGQGFAIAMQTLDGGRIGIAAQALGLAQGAFDKALEYAQERNQFGQPIARQQAVAFKLAEMATRIRAARFMVYSAAYLKEQHLPYSQEAAMAKMYASDICLEAVNEAVQIFGGNGFIKGFPVERMYRDAKITTIYEGTNEIQKLVISSALLGRAKKEKAAGPGLGQKPGRRRIIINSGSPRERVDKFVGHLREEGLLAPGGEAVPELAAAPRVVCAGMGLTQKEDLAVMGDLAQALGAALGCSRPVAEERKWLPMGRFVGISGQKFSGQFYLGVGVSGQVQHIAGIQNAKLITAINRDEKAPLFEQSDYGIVGDLYEIVPLLLAALKEAPRGN